MPKKILLIEDEDMLRELITKRLTIGGYEIIQSTDGISGLKAAQEQRPDLVLLDIVLPGIDGFEVLEKIKNDASLSRMPVVMLSNLSQKNDIEKALKLGAVDYFIKINFTSEEVLEKIKNILK
ncbi:MAG: response regulator [Candidatus Staskawiczbacteria bacterium]|nr:response regulator [Candidatus Staskawiczbacteria bacterium]